MNERTFERGFDRVLGKRRRAKVDAVVAAIEEKLRERRLKIDGFAWSDNAGRAIKLDIFVDGSIRMGNGFSVRLWHTKFASSSAWLDRFVEMLEELRHRVEAGSLGEQIGE